MFDCEIDETLALKSPGDYRLVGKSAPRLDLPDKIAGRPRFIQDMAPPGMLYGRAVRPPHGFAALTSLDDGKVKAIPGVVAVVRDGAFVGVIAEREEVAISAQRALRRAASWKDADSLPQDIHAWLKAHAVEHRVISEKADAEAQSRATQTLEASYTKPYISHAPIGPSCAIAQFQGDKLLVWSHSQGIFNLRRDLAMALGMREGAIVVRHVEGSGCYGHNASLASDGGIVDWRHELWSNGHSARPGRSDNPALVAAWHLARPFKRPAAINMPLPAGAADRNAVPLYDFPSQRVVNHYVREMPVRTSALRSLGAYANVFAIESFMDELADAAGLDPVEFRLRHLKDERARTVVEAAAQRANWTGWTPAEGRGHGIGFAKYKNLGAYCAVVAEVEVDNEVRVKRLVLAVDVGLVINPDGVINQIEGGAIQSTSWTLKEQVKLDARGITSLGWEEYPVLKFSEVPAVEVELIDRPELPSVGAGEAAQGPTGAAIANAVAHALGLRVREVPLTPERVIAAIERQ